MFPHHDGLVLLANNPNKYFLLKINKEAKKTEEEGKEEGRDKERKNDQQTFLSGLKVRENDSELGFR